MIEQDEAAILKKLRQFAEGTLNNEEKEYVKKLLRENERWLFLYTELREALLLQKQGHSVSSSFKKKILKKVIQENVPQIQVRIRSVGGTVSLVTVDNQEIKVNAVMIGFEHRGEKNIENGAIRFERTIAGKTFSLVITPKANKYQISLMLQKPEPLSAVLYNQDQELEEIPDLSKDDTFEALLPANTQAHIEVFENSNLLFKLHLNLETE